MKLMVKLLFALIFICSVLQAQTAIPKGKIHPGIPGDGTSNKFFSVMTYYDPVTNNYYYYNPVTESSNTLILLSYMHPYTLRGGTQSTVSTEIDTVTFTGATTKVKWIVFAKNDSLEASLKGDFSDAQPIPTNTSFTFDNFSPVQFPKGFIRRWGTVGIVSYSQSWLAY